MSLVSFFTKHQKKILILLILLAALFLFNRRFKILEGLDTAAPSASPPKKNDASAVNSLDDIKKLVAAQINKPL